ncbi:MAG: hypothetical protein AAF480_19435 [Actinomycetota bacterium]
MTHVRWIRIALGYVAVVSLQVGLWALFAPRSFYDDFPGLGMAWVNVDGPYNEHLVRDVGGLNLALAIVVIAAAVTLSRPLIFTAVGASLAIGVPHFLYHLVKADLLDASDATISLIGLGLAVVLPAAVAWVTITRLEPSPAH